MEDIKRPGILEINILYLVLGVVLLFGGYFVQSKEIYSGLLITEYIIILLPNLLYLKFKGYSIISALRFNKISLKQIFFILLIVVFSYPIAVFLNLIVITLLSNITTIFPTPVPIPSSNGEYLLGLFVIALAPGICEEIMFRGTMMLGYNRLGYKKSIIITAILFGFFHFNIINLVGPIFLGLVLGMLVHKTNSILASILAHTLNNGIALSIGYLFTRYAEDIDKYMVNQPVIPEKTQMLISVIFFAVLAIISAIAVILLFRYFPSTKTEELGTQEYCEEFHTEESQSNLKYVPLIVVFLIFILINYKVFF